MRASDTVLGSSCRDMLVSARPCNGGLESGCCQGCSAAQISRCAMKVRAATRSCQKQTLKPQPSPKPEPSTWNADKKPSQSEVVSLFFGPDANGTGCILMWSGLSNL